MSTSLGEAVPGPATLHARSRNLVRYTTFRGIIRSARGLTCRRRRETEAIAPSGRLVVRTRLAA